MATFAQDMVKLSSLNFLGGLADVGAAVKAEKQNQNLVDLYEQFKTKSNQIDTTDKQVADFNQVAKSADANGVPPPMDVTQGLNLFSSLDKINRLNKAYQPYITAFSMLGEDGIRVAKAITNDLSAKVGIEQAKTEIPLKELQYKQLALDYNLDRNKWIDYIETKKANKELQNVEDAIVNSPIFKSIEALEKKVVLNTKYGENTIKQHTTAVNALTEQMRQMFPNVTEGVLSKSIAVMLNTYGKTVKGEQAEPRQYMGGNGGGNNGFTQFDWNENLSKVRNYSQEWTALSDETKAEIKKYADADQTADQDTGIPAKLSGRIKELYDIFRPGGKFDEANTFVIAMSGMFGANWLDNKALKYSVDKNIDPRGIGMTLLDEDKKDKSMKIWDLTGGTRKDLIITRGARDLLDGVPIYDPTWEIKRKDWGVKKAQEEQRTIWDDAEEQIKTNMQSRTYWTPTKE